MKMLLFGLSLLITSGCTVLPKAETYAVHDFGFALSASDSSQTSQAQINVIAPDWLADNRIRYRLLYSEPTQVRFYTLDRWIAPPNDLIEQLLLTKLSNQTWPLTIQLQSFEQQFNLPGHDEAVMTFQAISFAGSSENPTSEKDFFLKENCPTADAKGAVTAFSRLTPRAADEIMRWLNQSN
ncbi:MAG: membrane integrity-associated transporter subunit PqiC [Methylococcaceae bacterium]|nr:membrane integrity-associated transporter subunit PqiC [Methylococcaceae bacterium]